MITIPIKHLKVAILAAGSSASRPHLCGVMVECMAGETRVVASDGDIIVVMRQATDDHAPRGKFILPRQVVTDAITQRMGRPDVSFEPEPATGKWVMNGAYRFDSLGSDYPDYRLAFVDEVSGQAAHYNPNLVAQFGKMARALSRDDSLVTIHQNGESNAMVSIYDAPEFAGAIAPMRANFPKAGRPGVAQWVRQ